MSLFLSSSDRIEESVFGDAITAVVGRVFRLHFDRIDTLQEKDGERRDGKVEEEMAEKRKEKVGYWGKMGGKGDGMENKEEREKWSGREKIQKEILLDAQSSLSLQALLLSVFGPCSL